MITEVEYVPGRLECKKCGCSLISSTLYVKSGTIGANNKSETCPNGCGPMWRVTWKDYAKDAVKTANKLAIENVRLRKEVELLRVYADEEGLDKADTALEKERKEWAEIDRGILDG